MRIGYIILMAIILCGIPVSASVQYPDEYYRLTNKSNLWYTSRYLDDPFFNSDGAANTATIGSFIELRRQTIAMELQNELLAKQNELLISQNEAMWVSNCYVPHTQYAIFDLGGDIGALKTACIAHGYPMQR
jgi:hypothetical protein